MINKALIGAINIEDRKKIEIPEWKAELYIKAIKMEDTKILDLKFKDNEGKVTEPHDLMIYYLILFLQEKDGSAVFTEDDFDLLLNERTNVIIRIFNEIQNVNKVDVDEIKKK